MVATRESWYTSCMTLQDEATQAAIAAATAKILAEQNTSTSAFTPPVIINGNGPDGIRRFTSRRKNVQFMIDEDLFEAVGAAPADFMEDLGDKLQMLVHAGGMKQYEAVKDAISVLLLPSSRELFERRRGDFQNPITLEVVSEVGSLLLSEVSGRPTSPPPSSAPSLGETGTTSTVGPAVSG